MFSLLNKGDEVIVFAPFWVSYAAIIKLADGLPVFIDSTIENDFKPTTKQLKNAITNKTKAKIITAIFSLIKGLNTEMSTADPTIIKNIGINTSATGFSLSSISVF
mgnify:CR=1 FL=1